MAAEGVDTSVRVSEYRASVLNQQDLDRRMCLAPTDILKWMQAARQDYPWIGPGYRQLSLVEPAMTRRMIVASQMVRTVAPGALAAAVDRAVTVRCEVGAIGKTSVEFRYKVFFDGELACTGCTNMINVAGPPGSLKPSPLPEALRGLASPQAEGEDRAMLQAGLRALPEAPPAGAYRCPLDIRFSDEDVNKHANHSAMARFFDDAKEQLLLDEAADPRLRQLAGQRMTAILVSYAAESRALDSCEVAVAAAADGTALDVWVTRLKAGRYGSAPGLIARGRIVLGGGQLDDYPGAQAASKL